MRCYKPEQRVVSNSKRRPLLNVLPPLPPEVTVEGFTYCRQEDFPPISIETIGVIGMCEFDREQIYLWDLAPVNDNGDILYCSTTINEIDQNPPVYDNGDILFCSFDRTQLQEWKDLD